MSLLMLVASAQSYSVIIFVLLQLVKMQVIAGIATNKSNVSGFFNVAGEYISFV